MKIFWIWLLGLLMVRAQLEFRETKREILVKPSEHELVIDFPFTNRGQKAVEISKVEASCSCMKGSLVGEKKSFAPGESGVIRVNYDVRYQSGELQRSVGVWVNGEAEPQARLEVDVKIPITVEAKPSACTWILGEAPSEKVIAILMHSPTKILKVTSEDENFLASFRVVKEGERYEVVLKPKETKEVMIGKVKVETDAKIPEHRVKTVYGVIREDLTGR